MRKTTVTMTMLVWTLAGSAWAQDATPDATGTPKPLTPPKTETAKPKAATPAPKGSPKPSEKATPVASPSPKASPNASASPSASASASPAASPAPSPTPAVPVTVVVQAPTLPPPEPQGNPLLPGLVGLGVVGGLGFLGWRIAKNKGVTMEGALQKAGVTLPDDIPAGGGVSPNLKPAPPPQPPLPSLADLPSAGSAPLPRPTPNSGGREFGMRLVGLMGSVSGQVIPLVGTVTVGREAGNTLALPAETSLSRNHARIEQTPGGWQVVDNNSTNGTFVNGQRIQGAMPIAPGDEIQMGAIRFRFEG